MAFRKIEAGLVHGSVDNFIGKKGTIFYDNDDGVLRLSDGTTPGGNVISGGSGGGTYTLPTATTTVKGGVKIDGTTITINNQVISGFSGSYTDLSNKPTIPSNTNQLTNGAGYITSASLPTAVSQLSNDTGFLTTSNFDLDTIDLDANNKLHATGILPGDAEGFTAVFAGRAAGVAALPNTVIQSQAEVNDYAQNNFQNTYDGNHASTEWVATSPNGDDSNYYIDLGISGASWDGTASNSLYTNAGQRDGWLYVQGGNAGGGNLILGTSLASTYTKIIAGNASAGNTEVARFSSTEVKLKKQLTFNDNTTQTTAWTGTVDWADVTNTPTILTTLGSLSDVLTAGATDGQVLKYNSTAGKWQPAADLVGSGGSGIGLTDLSASNNSASGGGSLSYNNTTGVFTFTPPDLSTFVTTSSLSSTLTSYATTSYVTSQGYITSSGNAATATRLGTARTINNVSFDGSASITVTANTNNALTIGTGLSGTSFNGSTAVTIAIDNTVALRADTHYIGTTSIALNRSSASQTLTGISIDGNAATVTNGVYTNGSYSNPAWITSLAYSKITGAPSIPVNVSQLVNDSGYITSSAIPPSFTFNVTADDSTLRTIGTEETVKFIGAGGITTSTDAEGAVTITQGSTDTVIKVAGSFASNSAFKSEVVADLTTGVRISTWWGLPAFATEARWQFDYDGILTFPDGTEQITAWTGTSTTLQWTAAEFFPNATATATVTTGDGAVDINLVTGMPGSSTSVNWSFTNQGTIVFPDSTTQYSAYTGDSSTTEALTIGTGLSGTSFNGSTPVTIALDDNYGDTKNPYASKTAKYFLASPNAANGAPTFRAIVASDIPTLNQNTTGSAATLTTARSINGVSFNGSADITVTAAAGTLTGTTLNSTVVSSSLTSVGTLTSLSSGAITTTGTLALNASGGITTNQTTFPLVNTTATTVNFAGAATAVNIGATTGTLTINNPAIVTGSTGTLTLFNTNATTVTAFGSAGTINLGYTNNTGSSNTFNISTQAQAFNTSKTVNIGTGSAANSTTAVNLGSTSGTSTVTVNGTLVGSATSQDVFNTTATTINFAGAATTLNIGTSAGIVNIASAVKAGTGTFTKAGYATGDILLDNGSTDTPGLLMYYANNNNFAIDSWNGTFSILSGQLVRITNNLNESSGAVKMAMDTTGNMVTTGFIQPGAWRAGQVIRDTMLNNSDFTVNNTTVATSTSDTDLLTYSYTPTSNSSYLIIHVHVADYRAASDTGGAGTDSYFSRIKVDGSEITYARQLTKSNESFRTGTLFPLTGRYTNSSTTAKSITVGVRRDSADDSITVTNSATALWMRITEIAR